MGSTALPATDVTSTQRSRIFISYRREDSEHAAGRLAADLQREFSPQQVFLDIASIEPGADFGLALKEALADCAAVLVLIGQRWLAVADEAGRRRLDSPDDWVRQEIAESLQRPGVRVLPILLDAAMPDARNLPEDIRPLTRRQALPLTSRHWSSDLARLVELLKGSPGLNAAAERAPNEHVRGRPALGWLARAGAKRRGLVGAAFMVLLAAAGVAVLRPNWIGMRAVAIAGVKPLYAPYKTGDVFQECAQCPEMVVIVPVTMEPGGGMRESSVPALKPFAIGKYEITRAQFLASAVKVGPGCWDGSGDREKMRQRGPSAPGYEQTDDHPVVCVNVDDIRSYLAWLNSRTGTKPAYRLPSQAEWFYAAMAGTGDVEPWRDDRGRACEFANVHDLTAAGGGPATFECSDGYAFSAPVGRFKANAWGLHDTIGNVAEWLQDCGRREPRGEACDFRVYAGGHYGETLRDERRYRLESPDERQNSIGFRVARYL